MEYKVDYKIVECYQTKNSCYKLGIKCTKTGIIRHNTGAGNKYLKRYVDDVENLGKNQYGNHWNQTQTGKDQKMVHYFIGLDKNDVVRIYHVMPDNYKCWGNGSHPTTKKSCNVSHIQYEICDDGFKDKGYFEATHKAARYLEAYLCKKHGWNANVIMSHWESYLKKCGSAHGDDEDWLSKFGTNMDNERKLVQKLIDEGKTTPSTSASTPKPTVTTTTAKPVSSTITTSTMPSKKDVVKALQTALNKDYNAKLAIDGSYGTLSSNAVKAHNIKAGAKSNTVKWLQTRLKELGCKGADGKVLSIDGDFGSNTAFALKQFQKAKGLTADGICGTGTVSKILSLYK